MKAVITIIPLLLFINTFTFAQSVTQRIDSVVNSFHEANPEVSISIGFVQDGEEFCSAYGNTLNQETLWGSLPCSATVEQEIGASLFLSIKTILK